MRLVLAVAAADAPPAPERAVFKVITLGWSEAAAFVADDANLPFLSLFCCSRGVLVSAGMGV